MIIKAKGTVTIPARPRSLGQVLSWCKSVNRALQQLRDRAWDVPMGRGRQAGAPSEYIPWDPNFFREGDVYKVRFNLGTDNNVAADNWDDEHTLADSDALHFVILEVTTSDGKITGLEITLASTPLDEDYVTMDTPPSFHKVLLGVISKNAGSMIVTTNISEAAVEVYRESKVSPAVGAEPFSRYWRWQSSPAA